VTDLDRLTIIVPTRNNVRTIGALLRSVERQTVPPDEVLVVDGSSSDGTVEEARRSGAVVVSYRTSGDQRGFARNLGARSVRGGALLFLDSDMELSPNVVAACKDLIRNGAEAIVLPEINLGTGVLGALRSWERKLVQTDALLSPARCLRASVFETVGGYSEVNLGFEDLELQAALVERGIPIAYCSSAVFHHEEALTFGGYLRKRKYYSASASLYRQNHPETSRIVFSPLSRLKIYALGIRSPSDVFMFSLAVLLRGAEVTFGLFRDPRPRP
jgi:glycosyltransferase involved in cell wall biosynthesis